MDKHAGSNMNQSVFNANLCCCVHEFCFRDVACCRKLGLEKAMRMASACLELGPPWVDYNEFTQGVEFLYIEKGFAEEFSRAWREHQKWCQEKANTKPSTECARSSATPPAVGTQVASMTPVKVPREEMCSMCRSHVFKQWQWMLNIVRMGTLQHIWCVFDCFTYSLVSTGSRGAHD